MQADAKPGRCAHAMMRTTRRARTRDLPARAARAAAAAARIAAGRVFVLRLAAAAAATLALAGHALPAHAQLSDRTVTLVVGSAPGGGVDRTARLLAARLAEHLHQPVIVENRAGAGTRLASDFVAKSTPDGRTLLFITGEATIDLAFDPQASPNILQDFTPVSLIAECPMLLVVNSKMPVHDVRQLLARARAAPGKLNYSTAGVKTTMHLVGELVEQHTGTDIAHIPYKGTVPALTALLAGDVDMSYASLASALPFVESGRLRALAIASSRRSPLIADVPTLAESGVSGVDSAIWYGLLAPATTSRDVVESLARAVNAVSAASEYRQALAAMGEEPSPGTPSAFGDMLRDEVAKWSAIIKAAGIRAE